MGKRNRHLYSAECMPGAMLDSSTDRGGGARERGSGARGSFSVLPGAAARGCRASSGEAARRWPWPGLHEPLPQLQPCGRRKATVPEAPSPRAPRLSGAAAAPEGRMLGALGWVSARVIVTAAFVKRRLGHGSDGTASNAAARGGRDPDEIRMYPSFKGRSSSSEINGLVPTREMRYSL